MVRALANGSYTMETTDTSVPRCQQGHEKYERLIARTKDIPAISTGVIWPCEEHALAGALEAAAERIIAPILAAEI